MSKPDDNALGEGVEDDGRFGGPTVRDPAPPSVLVRVLGEVQQEITGRHARVDAADGVPVVDEAQGGPTVPNSGPASLGDPPVKHRPLDGDLAYLGDPNRPRNWGDGKVGDFLDVQPTTPLPANPRDPREHIQKPTVSMRVVPSPVADKPTVPCAVSAGESQPESLAAQHQTLVIRIDANGVPTGQMVNLETVRCAADTDQWVRLAEALQRCFDRHVPGAVGIGATLMGTPPQNDSKFFRRDSLLVQVVDLPKYYKLRESVGRCVRSTELIPADLNRFLLLIWPEMYCRLNESDRYLRVRGACLLPGVLPDLVICDTEKNYVPVAEPPKSSLLGWLWAKLKTWR